jgi:serine/threonine protein phosphatase PrpC
MRFPCRIQPHQLGGLRYNNIRMWRVVPASVVGTSHERSGVPCQDAHDFLRINTGDDELLIIAVADGAGSAIHSEIGSSEAVQHLVTVIPHSDLNSVQITAEQVREWMRQVLNHLTTVAEREHTTLSQLACTLLLGIIGSNGAVFAQIGDGGWVVELDGTLVQGTWPQTGEFANITTFITTDMALDTMQFVRLEGSIGAVAGFTDGLQTLALNFAGRKPHAPFFQPMFDIIRACRDETSLIAPLQTFLASEAVTVRTDDDKTLVLACWRDTEDASNDAGQ